MEPVSLPFLFLMVELLIQINAHFGGPGASTPGLHPLTLQELINITFEINHLIGLHGEAMHYNTARCCLTLTVAPRIRRSSPWYTVAKADLMKLMAL